MSRDDDPRLLHLADRIGERLAVDWQREFLQSSDAMDLSILQSLETLGHIGELHASERLPSSAGQWGRLQILGELGRGSFGHVLRAHDPDLQRDVALKLLDGKRTQRAEQRAQILREARALARLRHENVVTVHGVEEHDGQVGLWMELIEGKSLAQLVAENGPLGEVELRGVAATLARALAAVHREGVLHRDIKPQNVLRESGGRLVLVDLGASSRSEEGTVASVGTPLYLAPELVAGKAASAASDLYALGVTLFYLASGRHPIEASSMEELRRAQSGATTARPHLADLRPELSLPLVSSIERCLAFEAGARWQSAGELLQALADAPQRSARWSPRRWLLASAAVLVLATLGAIGARGLWLRAATFEVDAAVFRWTAAGREELDAGALLGLDDAIGLRLRADRPLHVYVLNEDGAGRARLLFPLPWLQTKNPLAAGVEHRLPGQADGEERAWGMSEEAGSERLVVLATRRPVPELEEWIRTLPVAQAGEDPALDAATLERTQRRLRGLGKIVSVPSNSGTSSFGSLGALETLLSGPQAAQGIWVRRFDYRSGP